MEMNIFLPVNANTIVGFTWIKLVAYFSWSLIPILITGGVLFIRDKSCLYCCRCLTAFAHPLQNRPANGKQGPGPEEMSQTLMIKKQQGKIYLLKPLTFTLI